MAFKMKGSPMKRNFGVGSPAKQVSKPMGGPGDVKKDDSPSKQFLPGDYYDTRSKKGSPAKQDDGQEKTDERLGKGIFDSPAKQKKSSHEKEIKAKNESDTKYMSELDKKRKKKAQEEIDAINNAYINKMNISSDSLNVANQSFETQQQKDYRTMSAAEYQKKYGKKK